MQRGFAHGVSVPLNTLSLPANIYFLLLNIRNTKSSKLILVANEGLEGLSTLLADAFSTHAFNISLFYLTIKILSHIQNNF